MAIYDPRRNKKRRNDEHVDQTKPRLNMHDGVADWCDCCVCEAEPRWEKVAEQMGINLSDYEDD
jgi:hypothetical protein